MVPRSTPHSLTKLFSLARKIFFPERTIVTTALPEASSDFPSSGTALAIEATKVAEMVHRLPSLVNNSAVVQLLQQAALDSFFISVRALVEFLGVHPAPRDRSAGNLLSTWTPPADQPLLDRLEDHWGIASRHVMHFGQTRTKAEDGTVEKVGVETADLERIADDVLTVWDAFVDAVDNADLMYKSVLAKRGTFRYWNSDGTSQR